MRNIAKIYASPSELMRDVSGIDCPCHEYDDKAFNGASIAEIKERAHGWPGGLAALASLPGWNTPPQKGQWKKKWNDDDGDTWDQERYLDERPFLSKRIRTAGGTRKTRNMDLIVNPWENCKTGPEEMLWKAYAGVKIADELENAGIRCRILSRGVCNGPSRTVETYTQTVTLKDYADPLNASLLVSWLAPWSLRYWTFKAFVKYIPGLNSSYGSTGPIGQTPGALTIDKGDCLSEKTAKDWIKKAQQAA